MEWKHKCSLEWLQERQKYLTASDIKRLLPVTATGRPRKVTDIDRLKVMSSKMIELTEEDCMSFGAAARGHILEPYAIMALNNMLVRLHSREKFYWWDDQVIHMPNRSLAFSPDAMNVPQTKNWEAPSAIAEVKSYGIEKHLVTAYTPKDKIEERWQIATSMAVLSQIDHAYLVLFNPKCIDRKAFIIHFDRSELENEIEIILQIEEEWDKFVDSGILTTISPNGAIYSSCGYNEQEIIEKVEMKNRLNPL